MMANNQSNNNQNNARPKFSMGNGKTCVDPLGFNPSGLALTAGVFSISYKDVLNRLQEIGNFYLGDAKAKIEYWVDNDVSSYDPDTKKHSNSNRVSFQIWIKKDNPNLSKVNGENDFVDSVISYSDSLKSFIKDFGIDNDNNIRTLLNKRGNAFVLLVDPTKLFASMFDMNGTAYRDATGSQLDRYMEIRTECLYDNEDPIKALRNIKGRRREKPELTGFLVIKSYAKLGSFSNGTFRPPLNTHKHHEDDRDEDREFKKKFKSL